MGYVPYPDPNPILGRRALMVQWKSTSRLALLTSRSSSAGDMLCRYSMPCAASSSMRRRRGHVSAAAAACRAARARQRAALARLRLPARGGRCLAS